MFARDHLALSTNSQNLNNEVSQLKIFYKLWIIWSGQIGNIAHQNILKF